MKTMIIALACALAAPLAFAQTSATTTQQTTATQPTTTATTTTTASGTVTTYTPRKKIVVRSEGTDPISYVFGKTVHYVIEGKLDKGTLSGSWNHDNRRGDFKVSRVS